jgi:hypothetical protein
MLHVGLVVAGLATTYGPAKIPVFPGAELPALLARLRYGGYGEIIPLDLYNYQMGMGNQRLANCVSVPHLNRQAALEVAATQPLRRHTESDFFGPGLLSPSDSQVQRNRALPWALRTLG